MKRREFVRKSISAGVVTGTALGLSGMNNLWAANSPALGAFDLVAVKGGEPDAMFDQAIAAMGGMGQFVSKNQTVVVKPNIGWDRLPDRAANTNPILIKRIVEHCFKAGAKDVFVFDHTCDNWTKCYKTSGIEKYVKDAGGKMVPGNTENYYQEVTIPGGKKLLTTKVHELILESDVFINVPVLKNHSSTKLSLSMKNLMGVVWDRRFWHKNDLHQCIADYASYQRKPDLNIVDAYNAMMKNGPQGVSKADVLNMKSQLVSTDMVAIDAAAAKLFGMEPETVPFIRIADEMKLGTMDLSQLSIKRIKV
ncbi:MAG: DUF362 domain-containing protein [Bacteroidales bacterium]|nr:DUF362 domain-containing protein [Bacteroidales bacterium]